jgi:alanine dehydrogenase
LHDVVHYCVANMPGAVPRTSTYALNNATLPFILALADQGPHDALLSDTHFLGGLNICGGMLTEQHVAEAHRLDYVPPAEALAKVYA